MTVEATHRQALSLLEERHRTFKGTDEEFASLENQIAKLKQAERKKAAAAAADAEEVAREARLYRRRKYDAALAEAKDQAAILKAADSIENVLHQIKPLWDALAEANTSLRDLIVDITGRAPISADQYELLLHALYQTLANDGMPMRFMGKDPNARTIRDVVQMILGQVRGNLEIYGREQGYNRADWAP